MSRPARKPARPAPDAEAELRLGAWRAALDRPLLPVSWPAEAGDPPDTGACSCCRNRGWHRVGSGWVCRTCHPPIRKGATA